MRHQGEVLSMVMARTIDLPRTVFQVKGDFVNDGSPALW